MGVTEQEKREKVIKGLKCHKSNSGPSGWPYNCSECPYKDFDDCDTLLQADIIVLLKTQEPRVMTLEEVLFKAGEIGFPCWIEDKITEEGFTLLPAVVISNETYIQYYGDPYYEGAIYHYDYNKRLRCWTSRPTEEQRKAVAWND